jgi:hypothetical protein
VREGSTTNSTRISRALNTKPGPTAGRGPTWTDDGAPPHVVEDQAARLDGRSDAETTEKEEPHLEIEMGLFND